MYHINLDRRQLSQKELLENPKTRMCGESPQNGGKYEYYWILFDLKTCSSKNEYLQSFLENRGNCDCHVTHMITDHRYNT